MPPLVRDSAAHNGTWAAGCVVSWDASKETHGELDEPSSEACSTPNVIMTRVRMPESAAKNQVRFTMAVLSTMDSFTYVLYSSKKPRGGFLILSSLSTSVDIALDMAVNS